MSDYFFKKPSRFSEFEKRNLEPILVKFQEYLETQNAQVEIRCNVDDETFDLININDWCALGHGLNILEAVEKAVERIFISPSPRRSMRMHTVNKELDGEVNHKAYMLFWLLMSDLEQAMVDQHLNLLVSHDKKTSRYLIKSDIQTIAEDTTLAGALEQASYFLEPSFRETEVEDLEERMYFPFDNDLSHHQYI